MPLVIESALAESFTAKFGASDFAAMLDALSQPPDELCVRVIGATREQRLRNKTAIVEAFGGLDQIVVGSFLHGDARKPANAKGVPLARNVADAIVLVSTRGDGAEPDTAAPRRPRFAVYVHAQTATAVMRGASLYCPGALALRPVAADTADEPPACSRGAWAMERGMVCEVRVAPGDVHITRGQDADAAWDKCGDNLVAEGFLEVSSRAELFADRGTAVRFDVARALASLAELCRRPTIARAHRPPKPPATPVP